MKHATYFLQMRIELNLASPNVQGENHAIDNLFRSGIAQYGC